MKILVKKVNKNNVYLTFQLDYIAITLIKMKHK